jgi:DNA-nicking Smr family endonuclease
MLTLDLHGLRHEDAKRKLELFINDHWGKMLKVITGNSSTMQGIVSSTAQFYDLDFTRCPLGTYIIIKSH